MGVTRGAIKPGPESAVTSSGTVGTRGPCAFFPGQNDGCHYENHAESHDQGDYEKEVHISRVGSGSSGMGEPNIRKVILARFCGSTGWGVILRVACYVIRFW